MSPFTEVDGMNLSAVMYFKSVLKGWNELNYKCSCNYITYLRKNEIASSMNLRFIYSVRFVFLVIHMKNVT